MIETDSLIIITAPMITPPWKGALPDPGTDLRTLSRARFGFLHPRPSTAEATPHMRWFITFSSRLSNDGYRHLQTNAFVFAKRPRGGILDVIMDVRVGDILHNRTALLLSETGKTPRSFRADVTEFLATSTPIVFRGLFIEMDKNGETPLFQTH